jgi:hypothetical protein
LIKIEDIVALYSALISEEKTILIVCEDPYELIPISETLISLIYPFEWCLPIIPFIVSDPLNPSYDLFEFINHMQSIIIGIHKSAYTDVKYKIEDEADKCHNIVVIELLDCYDNFVMPVQVKKGQVDARQTTQGSVDYGSDSMHSRGTSNSILSSSDSFNVSDSESMTTESNSSSILKQSQFSGLSLSEDF